MFGRMDSETIRSMAFHFANSSVFVDSTQPYQPRVLCRYRSGWTDSAFRSLLRMLTTWP